MQVQELTYLLQHPEVINTSQTDAVSETLEKYPYFQALHALHLKGLKLKKSYQYNNAIKVTAAHTTDRSILFDYITSEAFNQNEISEQIKQNLEHIKTLDVNAVDDISVDNSIIIDEDLNTHIENTEGVLDPSLFEVKEDTSDKKEETIVVKSEEVEVKSVEEKSNPEEKLDIGKPLEFNKAESYTFSEWLKIPNHKPIDRDRDENIVLDDNVESEKISNSFEDKLPIIDRFLRENPRIKPVSGTSKPKLVNNDVLSESLMTETLARIYLEQKRYDKAIKSYKILSLKYPEKNGFFADQIKMIEELKDLNNI